MDRDTMRTQALQFYYMHNLYGEPAQLALRADFLAFWKACQDLESTDSEVLRVFDRLRRSDGFRAFVEKLP
jgi:hypothetical protein